MKKILVFLSLTINGFTLAHGLLFFLILSNIKLYDSILYHYTDSATWYILYFFLPILIGIFFYCFFRKKIVNKREIWISSIIAFIELAMLISISLQNEEYWGYYVKRPTVFSEVQKADEIYSCTAITNLDSNKIVDFKIEEVKRNYKRYFSAIGDYYYNKKNRVFLALDEACRQNRKFGSSLRIFEDSLKKTDLKTLNKVSKFIYKNPIVDIGSGPYYDTLGVLNGFITEFSIETEKYLIMNLNGMEVENDHYPFYEFLFKITDSEIELIKEQKFYVDIAGAEGFEFAYVSSIASIFVVFLGLIIIAVSESSVRIIEIVKKRKTKNK